MPKSLSFPTPEAVPEEYVAPRFCLRPLRETDVEADYAAVMSSRAFLRQWEQSGWPADDFTLEDNRADLIRHEREHRAGEAYTFTVLDPTRQECLGCVYIYPPDYRTFTRSRITALSDHRWADGMAIFLWVRTDMFFIDLDRTLLEALRSWLPSWGVETMYFVTSAGLKRQVDIFNQAGLRPLFEIDDPKLAGSSVAFG
ncbi:GNAT family N-acetyltransferase [Pontivivens insulae]|uniref:N-acetyltransferase domain-containing protein n=1 Tax=Pontivivens insulae TaxID=1639689 RepID=A0A2R8AAT2_9RHOB|nr:GNAT family N-acetyltransferase [Pontivivens insulae]RED13103.1 hypothetical protein DFR53_2238 [Pontivivens insulae]SPF29195.1 hypothetical protein POI8812_01502 [Pontivivens insulae]